MRALGTASATPRAPRFTLAQKIVTGVKEASDVVALPGGALLVVGDTSHSVGVIAADGSRRPLKLEGLPKHKASQFEGVAYDAVRHHLLLSREESREIWRYEWNPTKSKDPKLERKFSYRFLDGPKNKGLEGLVSVSGARSPTGRPALIGAKEGKPKELVFFDADGGGGQPWPVKLDQEARAVCRDLSAIAIDPTTGNLFVSSDESATLAQLELVRTGDALEARLVQAFPMKDEKGKVLPRIEGLTFNERGDLFVLTENDGVLRKFVRGER